MLSAELRRRDPTKNCWHDTARELSGRIHKLCITLQCISGEGGLGLPVAQAKCIDLLLQSADLGFPDSQYQLGFYYYDGEMGLERNEDEALKYFKEAAEGGDIRARNNLACTKAASGDHVAAMRHFRLSAAGGSRESMENLIMCFEYGWLHHSDLAKTLPAFYRTRAELMSEDRDQWIKHLKEIGKRNMPVRPPAQTSNSNVY